MSGIVKKFIEENGLKDFAHSIKDRPIINYFNTKYENNVLISYITYPFRQGIKLIHTNYIESLIIANIFKELGYNVDIISYRYCRDIDYSKYQVIFGFGEPLERSFYKRNSKIITIHYATGMHTFYQNTMSLKRIEEVYHKKGVWILESGRIIDKAWSAQKVLVDAMIVLGNEEVVNSYKKFFSKKIYSLPPCFYKVYDPYEIIKQKDFLKAKYNFLFFSGAGLIHKGLDLLLDIFKETKRLNLHICGPIDREQKFRKTYYDELYNTTNIHTYGFVNLDSNIFKELLLKCGFVVFPSCSEGGSPSVLNVMGNGGLIPIITKESSIDIQDFGILIDDLSIESVKKSILEAISLEYNEIKERSIKCVDYVLNNHSVEAFSANLKKYLMEIIENCK